MPALHDWKPRFIAAFEEEGTVTHAAKRAGISRAAVYNALRDDPQFKKDYDDALEGSVDALERAARERGLEKSDTLLIFLLKGRRPEVFGERSRLDKDQMEELKSSVVKLRPDTASAEPPELPDAQKGKK